jgi:hypothetical protein
MRHFVCNIFAAPHSPDSDNLSFFQGASSKFALLQPSGFLVVRIFTRSKLHMVSVQEVGELYTLV